MSYNYLIYFYPQLNRRLFGGEQTIIFLKDIKMKRKYISSCQTKTHKDLIIVFWVSYLQYTSTLIDFIAGDPKPFSALQ